jgi:hypothetical protein
MRFAKAVFWLAGVSGVLLVAPAYFLERWAGEIDPPPVNHSVYFYGFVGIVLVFQLLYVLIATDPIRYRPVMLLGALGKSSFAIAVAVLYFTQGIVLIWIGLAAMDATLVVLFLIAFARLSREKPYSASP